MRYLGIMIVKIGDMISSDFGTGKIVAITKEWIIHKDEEGAETAALIKETWLPVEVETTPENRGSICEQAEI